MKAITIADNEEFLRQISKEVDLNDENLLNDIKILEELKISESNKSNFNSSAIKKLIEKKIVLEEKSELYREAKIEKEKKKSIELTPLQVEAYENIINSKFFKKQRLNDNESVIFNKWKNLFFVQIFLIFICIILKFFKWY